MKFVLNRPVALAAASVLALAGSAVHAAGTPPGASDAGCQNCHTARDGFAPSAKQLAGKMAGRGNSSEAVEHLVSEMREKGSIHSHRMSTDEGARAYLRALAGGAR